MRFLGECDELMIRVRVPATVANVGPAFDALGIAVSLYNTVELDLAPAPAVEVHGEGEGRLPVDARNLVYRAASRVAARVGRDVAFAVRCRNAIPIGRGLGSSAAAIVAGAVGANALFGRPLATDDLLDLVWQMEGHPDNVAAALLGGAVLTDASDGRLGWTRLVPVWEVALVVAVPEGSVATEEARRVLPAEVPFRHAVANVAHTAWLLTAMLTGQTSLLRRALRDSLHQPYRKALVPGMDEVFHAACEAGAFGAVLSGSGPSILAVAPGAAAEAVGRAMVRAFAQAGRPATHLIVHVDTQGTEVSQR